MTAPDREARTLASLDRCIATLRARVPDAADHTAPTEGDPYGSNDPRADSDVTGKRADEQTGLVENSWVRQAYR